METLLKLENVSKTFKLKDKREIKALKNINLNVVKGETIGIVGESGCGKSTLARVIMGVYPQTQGQIYFKDKVVEFCNRKSRLEFAEKVQMIFQDPYSSLNPRLRVGDIIGENLVIHNKHNKEDRKKIVVELLEAVGLEGYHYDRFPREFSGGQRQRICIARALAVEPELLICDEPISALDVSIQSQVMNLFKRLAKEKGITYIFIAHDLNMVQYIADKILVMYKGNIVEMADKDKLCDNYKHPYTKLLWSTVLDIKGNSENNKIDDNRFWGIDDSTGLERGCLFARRCEDICQKCQEESPKLREISRGHFVACHNVVETN